MVTPRFERRLAAAIALAVVAACDASENAPPAPSVAADAESLPAADAAIDALPSGDDRPDPAPLDAGRSDGRPDTAPDAAGRPAPGDRPRFRYGIAESHRAKMMVRPVFHVDHDPAAHPEAPALCTNFAGEPFPACYDGHTGSDFMLGGGFVTMDAGSAPVVAAAGGIVETAEDGHYDRCRGSVETLEVTCDGHEMRANFVRLRHANGWSTLYYHLKKGSVAVSVGQRVACGEVLGLVGSSGRSTLRTCTFRSRIRRVPWSIRLRRPKGPKKASSRSRWRPTVAPGARAIRGGRRLRRSDVEPGLRAERHRAPPRPRARRASRRAP